MIFTAGRCCRLSGWLLAPLLLWDPPIERLHRDDRRALPLAPSSYSSRGSCAWLGRLLRGRRVQAGRCTPRSGDPRVTTRGELCHVVHGVTANRSAAACWPGGCARLRGMIAGRDALHSHALPTSSSRSPAVPGRLRRVVQRESTSQAGRCEVAVQREHHPPASPAPRTRKKGPSSSIVPVAHGTEVTSAGVIDDEGRVMASRGPPDRRRSVRGGGDGRPEARGIKSRDRLTWRRWVAVKGAPATGAPASTRPQEDRGRRVHRDRARTTLGQGEIGRRSQSIDPACASTGT